MIKGAIFDMDGTLLDSMFIWDTAGELYLRSLGIEPQKNLNETIKAMSLSQAACYYRSEYGVTRSVGEIIDGVNAMVEHYYRDEVQPKQGLVYFLNLLKAKNVRMCVATATDRYLVEAALERCGIRDYFSEIFTCTSVGHGKDEPVIYQKAMEHLGTDRSDTVIFEDALYAVKTAKNDGFITVAVRDPYERNQIELKAHSDFYLTDYSDFKSFWKFASNL